MMLVSLEKAKLRGRWDTDSADSDIELALQGASRMVLNYLGEGATFCDSSGDPVLDTSGVVLEVPEDVQNATLFLAAWMLKNVDGDPNKEFEMGYLPLPVVGMLYHYRIPTVA